MANHRHSNLMDGEIAVVSPVVAVVFVELLTVVACKYHYRVVCKSFLVESLEHFSEQYVALQAGSGSCAGAARPLSG